MISLSPDLPTLTTLLTPRTRKRLPRSGFVQTGLGEVMSMMARIGQAGSIRVLSIIRWRLIHSILPAAEVFGHSSVRSCWPLSPLDRVKPMRAMADRPGRGTHMPHLSRPSPGGLSL